MYPPSDLLPSVRRRQRHRPWIAGLALLAIFTGFLHAAPARAADAVEPPDRSVVVIAWQAGGAKVRAAAETALVGSDETVRSFLTTDWLQAQQLDERDALVDVIATAGPSLRSAAQNVLNAGSPDAVRSFLSNGWQGATNVDDRLSVNQLMASGGPQVKQAAQQVLDSENPAALQTFLDNGWQTQWQTDQRLQINQAMAAGGPEVQAAGQRALDAGTPEALQEFLAYGWDVASARDDEVTSLTSLLAEAQAAGDTAERETHNATDQAAKASAASQAAEQAAAEAAAATASAKANAKEAAAQATRAANAARKAAQAAAVAIDAADAADRAAHAAARAAGRAAAMAAKASQQATNAYNAAAAAASDRTKAGDARKAAESASAIAKQANDMATIADHTGKALEASRNAIADAKSAAKHAIDAAGDNDRAAQYARDAGVDASAAVNAAQVARANAARAQRAAQAAENYLTIAITAAYASRDAARRAASDANAAAAAANEAADDAGNAALAATRSAKYAAAAATAAKAAIDAAGQAGLVYQGARQVETDRLAVAKDQGIADAQAASQAYDAQQKLADWDVAQSSMADAETRRVIAEAQNPATATDLAVADSRKGSLALASAPGTFTREAARAALGGTDEDVLAFVRTGLAAATAQDDRQAVMDLSISDNAALTKAALAALAGSDAAVSQFLQTQNYPGRYSQDRLKVNQIMSAAATSGDTFLAQAAQTALNTDTDPAFREFLDRGQYTAAQTGQRVQVNNIMAGADSGPETKAFAQVALDGPPSAITDFLSSGRFTAAQRDADTAAHLAVVSGLLDKTNQAAETALQHAQEAQSAAARAAGDANAATTYANQAAASAQQAAGYATSAQNSANQAAQSVQKAADAVKSARAAATRANASARNAIRSAAWAIASQTKAQKAAAEARDSAARAKKSALEANADARAAAAAGQQAYTAYQHAQGIQIAQCATDYANHTATDLESLLGGGGDSWYRNCVRNVIADPSELAQRAYVNSAFCSVYPQDSQLYQNCIHSTLDPAFRGTQQLDYINAALLAAGAMFLPAVLLAGIGCLVTVCGPVVGALLTISDVGLNVVRFINGDQSLANTLLNLGKTAVEALLFDGVGKLLNTAFRQLKALRAATQTAKIAESELKQAEGARQWVNGLASCVVPTSLAAGSARALAAKAAKSPCPSSIALGLTDTPDDPFLLIEFADTSNSKMWRDWPQDWNWNTLVEHVLSPEGTSHVNFNLDGVDDYLGATTPGEFAALANGMDVPEAGLFTPWELRLIRDAPPSVRARVTFWLNGKVYPKDPFTQWP